MAKWTCLSMLLFAGCAHLGPDGKPISSVKWCARGPIPLSAPQAQAKGSDWGPFGTEARACMPLLARETYATVYEDVPHETVFGLTTDAHGMLTDVCLLGTTLPPTLDFFECVAAELMKSRTSIERNRREAAWRLTTVFD